MVCTLYPESIAETTMYAGLVHLSDWVNVIVWALGQGCVTLPS